MAISPKSRSPYNNILDTARTITTAEQEVAIQWLEDKHAAGELPGFSDVEGDTLELFLDMLGLNGRPLRDTFKPSAAEKYAKRKVSSEKKKAT